jgi:hypothetical protein
VKNLADAYYIETATGETFLKRGAPRQFFLTTRVEF